MSVLRIYKKQNNFVILDKTCLNEEKLSWGAKGLHAYLISLPDDWQVRVVDLQKRSANGRDAVRAFINELEKAGYIKKTPVRNEKTGQFGGIEFLVLEAPEQDLEPKSPEEENQSSVENEGKVRAAGNPSAGLPESEKATLININLINIKLINNKTAAESNSSSEQDIQQSEAAAVFSSQNFSKQINHPKETLGSGIRLTPDDALIGEALTANQLKLVDFFIRRLNCDDALTMHKEVTYCLLSLKHFTACGQDFSHKLNAIRKIIMRGDWQTPAEMLLQVKHTVTLQQKIMEDDLTRVKAEAIHFQKLMAKAQGPTQQHFQNIIQSAHEKISQLEQAMEAHASVGISI